MSLLKELLDEMAAGGSTGGGAGGSTSAHGVASAPGSLFKGGIIDGKKNKAKQTKMMRRLGSIQEALGVDLGKNQFDASDVVSKMDAAEKKMKANKDTTTFGMEDEEGNLVKVYVKTEQAEEFEQTLAALLAGADEDDNDRNSSVEIAEVLYQLKDKFEIVDVEWPTIEGDEEEEQEFEDPEGEGEAEGGEGKEGDDPEMEASVQAEGPEGGELEAEVEGDLEGDMGGEDDAAASALTQVIDALKADAQAREAEAKAKEAEANAKEAEYSSRAAASKVEQEEQVLDMEAYNTSKKDQDKEVKTLAQLAKYKHDLAADDMQEGSSASVSVKHTREENEEEDGNDMEPWRTRPDEKEDKELTQNELGALIFRHLRSN